MKEHRTAKIGIGLGNIYKRVHMMYQKGKICGSTAGKEKEQDTIDDTGRRRTQGEEVYKIGSRSQMMK